MVSVTWLLDLSQLWRPFLGRCVNAGHILADLGESHLHLDTHGPRLGT